MDVDFGASAQAANGGDSGKQFTKLMEGDGDWLGMMCYPRLADHGFRSISLLGWVAEMESFFDGGLHEACHSEGNRSGAVRCIETAFRQSAAFGCAVFENGLGQMDGMENLVPTSHEFGWGFDTVEELHQRE